jgi:hypothetical protein
VPAPLQWREAAKDSRPSALSTALAASAYPLASLF